MTPSAIQTALGQHLAAGVSRPIVWPNKTTTPPPRPYLVMQAAGRSDFTPDLNGEIEYSTGRQVVVVVSDLNAFATAADDLAYAVKARFPKGLRLGDLVVSQSQVLAGYADDVSWRVPVEIAWST